ncbi:glutathione S-transferase family protein [Zavarzinia sp. CC-PAN008]|uniref:glutathione S-transferase family protein n=1 Tax=Zavarzinia sp. CC-PAN008 TaxID=3243332 RepID=UPI003F744FD0
MKLINSIGPNPHVVRMFAAEKGIDLPKQDIDLLKGENRQPPYNTINVTGTTPALVLDNGQVICEITTISEYLEEKHPTPALIGSTPEERAETRMWTRRIDLGVLEPLTNGFRATEGRALFEPRIKLVSKEAGQELKGLAQDKLAWLDGQLGAKQYICGDRFTLADILLFCFIAFAKQVGQDLPADAKNLRAWFERVGQRPSVKA